MTRRLAPVFLVILSALVCACGDSSSPSDSGGGAGAGQGGAGGGVGVAGNGVAGTDGAFTAGAGGATGGTGGASSAGVGGSSAGSGGTGADAGVGGTSPASLEGTLLVAGDDADAFVDASGEFDLEVLPSASRTEPPGRIRVTWLSAGSLGGSLMYDEIRSDGSVRLVADAAVGRPVTPDTKAGRWVLETASKAAMEAAGVVVDPTTTTVRFTAVQLTRQEGATTIVLDGSLPYVP